MKPITLSSVLIALGLLTGISAFAQNNASSTTKKGFAVLEFFTSEGCSSCPPADELLGRIQKEYQNQELYVLAYHVDYWDRLGWKDVFSNAAFSKRQYQYADWLKVSRVYTPQVVVNGRTEHIASEESIVRNAIAKAFSKPAAVEISLNSVQSKNNLMLNYTVKGAPKGSNLLLALVQKAAKTNVKRGENSGRTLVHHQIVRNLQTIDLTKTTNGRATIVLPKEFNTAGFEVIGFAQDANNGQILGVAKSNF